jgi:hypothetical protein
MTTTVLQFVPLAVDHLQAADVLAKGGFLKGIGKFLLFGVLILVLLGVFIGMKVRGRRH